MSNVEVDKGELQKQLTFGVASDQVVQPFIVSALEEANGGPQQTMPQKAEGTIDVDDQGTAHVHTKYDIGSKYASLVADTTIAPSADGTYQTKDAKTGDLYRTQTIDLAMLQSNEFATSSTFKNNRTGATYDSVGLMDLSPSTLNPQTLLGASHEIFRRDGKVLGYVDATIRNAGLLDGRTTISYQVRDTNNKLLRTLRTVEDDQGLHGKVVLEQL